jgi:uncharacterized protein (DUF302 family)
MTGSTPRTTATVHPVTRLDLRVDTPYDEVVRRYEEAVPRLPSEDLLRLGRERGGDAFRERVRELSPIGMFLFFDMDFSPYMEPAGNTARCRTYLMGNPVIAETMYRHDPGVMLYAPLRTTIHEDADGLVHFLIDQPSTRFGSFDDPRIAEVGERLDRIVARLFEHLGFPVPSEIADSGG